MNDVTLIKYNAGNMRSVIYALERLNARVTIARTSQEVKKARRIIFPGVGAAGSAMQYLQEKNLVRALQNVRVPFLGICLGMQLLFESSEENTTEGLSIFPGTVQLLPSTENRKVPHMGWNKTKTAAISPLFKGVPLDTYWYFVHSFAAPLSSHTVGITEYGVRFSSAVEKDNFYGVQFHPEKSGAAGLHLLSNFLSI